MIRPSRLVVAPLLVALGVGQTLSAQPRSRGNDQPPPAADGTGVRGFGEPDAERAKPGGFGRQPAGAAADEPRSASRDQAGDEAADRRRNRSRAYARNLVKKYDANKNGLLERDEWSRIRGNPAKSDANRDGVLTVDEIANRLATYRRPSASDKSTGDKSSTGSPRRDQPRSPSGKPTGARGDNGPPEKKSYRFTPAHERLPDGLPSWFRQRDADGDGQVAMHEYGSDWSDRRARDFARHDKNGDGFLTPEECKR